MLSKKDAVGKKQYTPFIPPVKPNLDWPHKFKFVLVENLEMLREFFSSIDGNSFFSLDLETTGLNAEKDFIVGVCLAKDFTTGYYVPINHFDYDLKLLKPDSELKYPIDKVKVYQLGLDDVVLKEFDVEIDCSSLQRGLDGQCYIINFSQYVGKLECGCCNVLILDSNGHEVYRSSVVGNLGREALDMVYQKATQAKKVFYYNVRFDNRMLYYHGFDVNNPEHVKARDCSVWGGYDVSKIPFYDVAVGAWCGDTNLKMPSLKLSSENWLGIKQQTFEEVSDGIENFYYIPPDRATYYAASDALCTFMLAAVTIKYFKEASYSAQAYNDFLYPLMMFEHEKIVLDDSQIDNFYDDVVDRMGELESLIFADLECAINLNSPAQVGQAFERKGVDTGSRTATGAMSVGIELFEEMKQSEKERVPSIMWYVEYKTLAKLKSSYISTVREEMKNKGYLRCSYKTMQVPAGRLSSGADGKNDFFAGINIQSLPKPHPLDYYVIDTGQRGLLVTKKHIINGYQFIPCDKGKSEKSTKWEDLSQEYKDRFGCMDGNFIGCAEGFDPKLNIRSTITPKLYGEDKEDEWIFCSIDYSAQEIKIAALLANETVWLDAIKSGGDVHKDTAIKVWGAENYDKEKRKMAKGANFARYISMY